MTDQTINDDDDIIKEVQFDNWTQGVCTLPWVEPPLANEFTQEFTPEFT
jgi:hypothetical protein